MANGFVKGWKYLSAWFDNKVEETADPKIQIQQAIEQAQRQHENLTRQAANVLGSQHQLELKLDRQLGQVEQLQAQARQALILADKSRAGGDEVKAGEYEETAGMIANQLVTAENEAADLKQLHGQSVEAAAQARQAVEDNRARLQDKLSERTKLLGQLEQAKMQEQVSQSLRQMSELSAPGNTPTLEGVRDKIEKRYSVALGSVELSSDPTAGRMREVTRASVNMAGQSRLAEIRASLEQPASADTTAAGKADHAKVLSEQRAAVEAGSAAPIDLAKSETPANQPESNT